MDDLSHIQRLSVQGMVCDAALSLTYVTIPSYPLTTGLRIAQMVNFRNRTDMTFGGIVWSGTGRGSLIVVEILVGIGWGKAGKLARRGRHHCALILMGR
jgi:hypothetical protein